MKLKPVVHGTTNELLGYAHWCEGCKSAHIYYTEGKRDVNWTFNGNMEKPTFSPSMRLFERKKQGGGQRTLCHYFLTDGVINYLSDSSDHDLRGDQPLVDIPANYGI